jgi:FkbM family methyltransferase
VISSGGNDVTFARDNIVGLTNQEAYLANQAQALANAIRNLQVTGAQYILVNGLAGSGTLPTFYTQRLFADLSAAGVNFIGADIQPMIRLLHVPIITTIRRLPLPAALLAFRAYNKLMRMLGPNHIARTYFGARVHCNPDDLIQRMILYFGVWEPDVSRVIEQNLKSGDVFADIGANIGYDTLLASARVGAAGQVVSIEASPRTYELLQRNLALNAGATNVRAVNAAVSDRPGRLDIYELDAGNSGTATTLASRGGTLIASVDALPLEQILTAEEMQRLRLIKIDVEGTEPPILHHLLDQLSIYPPMMDIVVEASPAEEPAAWRDVFERLQAAGFTAWAIENDYELDWYLRRRRPAALQRVDVMAARQQDLFFTRR